MLLSSNNDFEELLGYYYYDLNYASAEEFELLPLNFLRSGLSSYDKKEDEPVMQVVDFGGIGESTDYLVLDTSKAGYFWTDLTYESSKLKDIENPVYKYFEYADLHNILKTEIRERIHLISLLLNQ